MDRARADSQANQLTLQLPPRGTYPSPNSLIPFSIAAPTHTSARRPIQQRREYALLTWFITPGWSEMTPMLLEADQSWV
jgi:hypothetical protein